MNKPSIALSIASLSAMMGGMFPQKMGTKISAPVYGDSKRTKRTKGKRHLSLMQRSNRQKAKSKARN